MASAAGGQLYYCYECQRTMRPSNVSDLVCPDCYGGFLEEWSGSVAVAGAPSQWSLMDSEYGAGGEDVRRNPAPFLRGRQRGYSRDILPMLEAMSSLSQHMQARHGQNDTHEDRGLHIRLGDSDLGHINPLLLFQGQMQHILGGNVDVFVDNGTGSGPQRLPANIGDYVFGPRLEQLIQQISENDPNRYGTPPASKSAIEALLNIKIMEDMLGTDAAQCAVCKDEFELKTEVKQMPCKHLYHPDCILSWLEQHNSCPVCRFELPTDDADYEQARLQPRLLAQNGNGGVVHERGAERGMTGAPMWSRERQIPGMRSLEGLEAAGSDHNAFGVVDSNDLTERGGFGIGRRFLLQFPWLQTASTSQSLADAQAETSSQASSVETVSSRSETERNEGLGGIYRASRTDDDSERKLD